MADDVRLKPCPCCGGRPVAIAQQLRGKKMLRIECSVCRIGTANLIFSSCGGSRAYDQRERIEDLTLSVGLEEARSYLADTWNRRPANAVPAAYAGDAKLI